MKFKGKTKMRAGIAMFAFAFMAPGLVLCTWSVSAGLGYLLSAGTILVLAAIVWTGAGWLVDGQKEAKDESH